MANKFDTRQSENRVWLRKIANRTDFLSVSPNGNELDNLLNAINSELSSAFELYPSNTPDLVLNVGANLVSNPETSIRHANPPINKQFPSLASGSITLPASSGGSIVVSPTITPAPTLVISANAYRTGLIECDSLGNLSITLGAEAASEALALANFPGINSKAFQIGLLMIQTIGGVVQNVTGTSIIQFTGGGGSGTTASGSGTQEPIPGYQWREDDNLDALITSSDSKLTASGYTNATQDLAKDLYRLSCDKSRTVATSSGTGLTINLTPGFTVVAGDIVYLTSGARSGQWRRIDVVNTQTNFTLDSAFSGGNAAASDTLMVSQAVWTKDLVNLGDASEKTRARDQFSGNVLQIAIDYFDSLVLDDEIADYVDMARIVVSGSNSGLVSDVGVPLSNTFSAPFVRAALPAQVDDYVLSTNTNQERLFLAFFPNPSNGSVTTAANLLKYEVSFFAEDNILNGGVLESAYCYTDGSGTEINCLTPFNIASKTRIQLTWSYVPTVNPGETAGQLQVRVDGKPIPRFVAGTTSDGYYKEIANPSTGIYDTIELDDDYLSNNSSVEVIKSEGITDTSNQNTIDIVSLIADRNVVTVTSAYAILANDGTILCDTTGGSFAVTLPSAISLSGKRFVIKKNDSTSNFITLNTSLAQTIDQQASGTIVIYAYGDTYTVESDGANWFYVSKFLSRQSAGMYLGSNQTISNSSVTQVDFTAANDINDSGIANPTSNNMTVKYGGRYLITANISYQLNAAGQRYLWVYINGIEIWGTSHNCDGNFKDRLSVTGTYPLSPGDTVTLYTYQTSSGSLILDATNSQSNLLSLDRIADKSPNSP